jgi:queuosine precursor transporter
MMSNEILFLVHMLLVATFVVGALRLGKEALVGVIGLLAVVANLFVIKQITLFGLYVTSGDVYIVGSVLALGVLQELHGKTVALRAIWISFFMALFYMMMSQVHLAYVPNQFDFTHCSFINILKFMPRIIFASILVHFIAQYTAWFLHRVLKKMIGDSRFIIRSGIVLVVSQALDTVLFSFAALYGLVHSVVHVMVMSFTIKVIVIACLTPVVGLVKRFCVCETA